MKNNDDENILGVRYTVGNISEKNGYGVLRTEKLTFKPLNRLLNAPTFRKDNSFCEVILESRGKKYTLVLNGKDLEQYNMRPPSVQINMDLHIGKKESLDGLEKLRQRLLSSEEL